MENNNTNKFELTDEMLKDVSGGRNPIVVTRNEAIRLLNQGICPRCRGTLRKTDKKCFGGFIHVCTYLKCPNPRYYLRPDGTWLTLP